ncbi:putative cytochrome P450 120 isoform X1 [Dreissena polymorpha]|uniref:Cytochrome P450 n=1 Tax=Dreissena polymorpha TaxID=45954 RepID=A0A9D3Z008_DREPO|nr:putative cytochrome P450 120 isoform X1 [Dreissena polymorpha]XP_052250744.1 putative cytochrome P450 120 isoform X1 [Dreissena polymorpha]KAH3707594.1 hypothetical protein DPMN_067004 [Dreissena polymorpha]
MAKSAPGTAGLPLLGDKSYEFYKDPVKFLMKHMVDNKSRVFLTRFLNKPTVFVGSNKVVHELLNEHSDKLELGYKQFMEEIYGENILFTDGDFSTGLRDALSELFTVDAIKTYQSDIDRIVKNAIKDILTGAPVCIYMFFKKLAIEICLSLFLGLDFSQSDASLVTDLTVTHWHGIISVPVAVKIPMMSETTYSKALDAKRKLLEIINERRKEKRHQFPKHVERLPNFSDVLVNNHLLLFTSALIPKALSSILTSFMIEIGSEVGNQNMLLEDPDLLERHLLEVVRLYPPFLAGRRIICEEVTCGGYRFPAGHALLYMTYAAHRDPDVFDQSDAFMPERWSQSNKNDQDKLFTLGAGPRQCIGEQLVWTIIKTVINELLRDYTVKLLPDQDLAYKWLPVSRPKGNVLVTFQVRNSTV